MKKDNTTIEGREFALSYEDFALKFYNDNYRFIRNNGISEEGAKKEVIVIVQKMENTHCKDFNEIKQIEMLALASFEDFIYNTNQMKEERLERQRSPANMANYWRNQLNETKKQIGFNIKRYQQLLKGNEIITFEAMVLNDKIKYLQAKEAFLEEAFLDFAIVEQKANW